MRKPKKFADKRYNKWAADGCKKPGKSVEGLSDFLGFASRQTGHNIVKGNRLVRIDEVDLIAEYIEEPPPGLGASVTLPIREIGVRLWSEDGQTTTAGDFWYAPKNKDYPDAEHFAFRVLDDSMIERNIFNGSIVVGFDCNGVKLKDNHLVVIKTVLKRDGAPDVTEFSVKVARVFQDRTEFHSASPDKSFKPVIVRGGKSSKNETVKAVAILYLIVAMLEF
jgi:hypothetical protein